MLNSNSIDAYRDRENPRTQKDVPLKNAVIAWNSGVLPSDVAVFAWPDDCPDHRGFTNETGACMAWWRDETESQRLNSLFCEAWRIVCCDGVSPKALHAALSFIPEYRKVSSWWFTKHFSNSPLLD